MTVSSASSAYQSSLQTRRTDTVRVQRDNAQVATAQRTRDNAQQQKATQAREQEQARPQPAEREARPEPAKERVGTALNTKA